MNANGDVYYEEAAGSTVRVRRVDANGTVFYEDVPNDGAQRIRKVDANGNIYYDETPGWKTKAGS